MGSKIEIKKGHATRSWNLLSTMRHGMAFMCKTEIVNLLPVCL